MKGYLVVSKNMESLLGENVKYKKNVTYYKKGRFSKYQNSFKVFKTIEDIQLITSVYKNRVFEVELGSHVFEENTCYFTNSITLLDEVKYDKIYHYLYQNRRRLANSENYVHKLILIEFGIIPVHLLYDESLIVKHRANQKSNRLSRFLFRLKRLGKYPRGILNLFSRGFKKFKKFITRKFREFDNVLYYRLFG